MPTYTLLASACPVPVVPSTICDPDVDTPLGGPVLVAAQTSTLRTAFQELSCRADLAARWSGGGYAIVYGLNISIGSNLNVNVSTGQAAIDAWVTKTSITAVPVSASKTRVYIYLMASGNFTTVNESLTPPVGACAFIGSCVTGVSTVTSVEDGGVMRIKGGSLWRRTADVVTPTDTPPGNLSFITAGVSKWWLWDGERYAEISPGSGAVSQLAVAANTGTNTVSATNAQVSNIELNTGGTATDLFVVELTVAGTPVVATSHTWIISNNTSYGCSIKKPSGSASGTHYLGPAQRAAFYFDGSEVREASRAPRYATKSFSATYTPATWDGVEADLLDLVVAGGSPLTANFPLTLAQKGRRFTVKCDESGSSLTVQAAGETVADRITKLLVGETQDFVVDASASIRRSVSRPYERRVSIEFTADLDRTLVIDEYNAYIIEMADAVGPTLTGAKNVIMPTVDHHAWLVNNKTAQTLTFKTSAGTGVAVATTKLARIYCDGTNIVGAVYP